MNREPGDIVLVELPNTDLSKAKRRPAVLLMPLPDDREDWLLCSITSQFHPENMLCSEVIELEDDDYKNSGLKTKSIIRCSRIAVINSSKLPGAIGQISKERLAKVKSKIINWLQSSPM